MSAKPPPAELIALFDSDPGKYKNNPLPDGYNPTRMLIHKLALAPQVPNPVVRPDVHEHDPMAVQDLYSALSGAELSSIGLEGWKAIRDTIESGDRAGVKRLANIALQKGWITQAKYDAIVAYVDAVVPDPEWTATVSRLNDLRANWPDQEKGIHRRYIHETVLGRV